MGALSLPIHLNKQTLSFQYLSVIFKKNASYKIRDDVNRGTTQIVKRVLFNLSPLMQDLHYPYYHTDKSPKLVSFISYYSISPT